MIKKTYLLLSLFLLIALLTACGQAEEAVLTEEALLTVGTEAYSQSELEGLGTLSVDYTNKDGETTTYSGVLLSDLLADAGADQGANVTFTAADGFSADMPLDEALDCANCIVAFDDGSLRMVMPELSGKLQVKDVIEISVD